MKPLEGAALCGFSATTDGARCRAFYEGKLGLKVVSDDPMAVVFNLGASMIRIQKLLKHVPQPFTILGWNVADIEASVTALEEAGVRCEHYGFPMQDLRGIATFPGGAKVAWLKDPDGNILSVAQL